MGSNERVDAVIAWVDGADEVHYKKRVAHERPTAKIESTRFANSGEIYYCIASILKYAKFINRIYIVTDNQKPRFLDQFSEMGLCAADYIRVIDHSELFEGYEEFLPTFNSLSIESMLWKIDGLADKYIYFNDDFFINGAVNSTDFFIENKPVLRGRYQSMWKFYVSSWISRVFRMEIRRRVGFSFAQMSGAARAGMRKKYLNFDHYPHPLQKKTQADFYRENENILASQIAHRFRSPEQFNPVALANHLIISTDDVTVLGSPRRVYFRHDKQELIAEGVQKLQDETVKFGCIQSFELFSIPAQETLAQAMEKKFDEYLPKSCRRSIKGI